MSILEEVFKDQNIIVYKLKGDNKKFIEFLADRIIAYSMHPFIHNYVRTTNLTLESAFELAQKRIGYKKDPSKFEGIISPVKILREHILKNVPISGDCDDKVLFLGTLLANMGYKLKVVGAFFPAHGKYDKPVINHVYLEYYNEKLNKWLPLEPTATYTRPGEIGIGVIPLYKVELSERNIVSKEIIPVNEIHEIAQGEEEMVKTIIGAINMLRSGLDNIEKFVKSYAEKRGIRYTILKTAMDFPQWIRSPLTWGLLGILGVSIWFNLAKIKDERYR